MTTLTKQVGLILIVMLILMGLLISSAYAQGCPAGGRVYVNTTSGSDETGNGTIGQPFRTIYKAVQVAKIDCRGAIVNVDGTFEFVVSIPSTEGTGLPIAESLLITGLVILAIVLVGVALLLRRRSVIATS